MAVEGRREHGALRERVVDGLREDIIEGRLAPGVQLRTEEVMERFGVSNSPLREAFAQLAAEGLVDVHRNRGAYVAEISRESASDLLRVGGILWTTVYRWSVPQLREIDLDALDEVVAGFTESVAAGRHAEAIVRAETFQGLVAQRCGSTELLRSLDGSVPRLRRLVRLLEDSEQVEAYGGLNRATLEAARAQDVDAAVAALKAFGERIAHGIDAALAPAPA